jgi:hypothetical protein
VQQEGTVVIGSRFVVCALVAGLLASWAATGERGFAQDRDADTIPDAVEEQLATSPDSAEELVVIGEDPVGEGADREQYAPCHDVTRMLFGNVAGDRYIWCIEFADDFRPDESGVILYIDADNDAATGRQNGAEGTEFMLHFSGGQASTSQFPPGGDQSPGVPARYVADGNRLYCTFDLPLNQQEGQSVFRLMFLSERREPHVGVDSIGWLDVTGPGESDREKIMTEDDITENHNVIVTRGCDLFEKLRTDERNVHIPVSECELDGFEMVDDEYREWSARRRGSPAAIGVAAPKGSFRPAIFVRDEGGPERFGIYIDDERRGVGIADEDDNRTKLLFLDDPVEFAGGERVEFRAARTAAGYRAESVIFLAEEPEVRPRKFELTHLEATRVRPPFVPEPTTVRLTWITSWPAACRVEFGDGETFDQQVKEDEPLSNHRVYLPALHAGKRYRARVVAPKPAGEELTSETVEFEVGAPLERTAPRPGLVRVPLTVKNASGAECRDWPVTSGIALRAGALMPDEPVRLADAEGTELAVQAEPLVLWPDGSVKWLLVTTLLDVAGDEEPRLYLEAGSQVTGSPSIELLASETKQGLLVETGAVSFRLPGDEPGELLADFGPLGADAAACSAMVGVLTDASGQRYVTEVDPSRTQITENGHLRCTVRVGGKCRAEDGRDARLFDWEARITAYRGKPFVRVMFTLGNDRGEEDFTEIKGFALLASRPAPVQSARIAGDDVDSALDFAPGVTLYQNHDDRWSLTSPDRAAEGTRAGGWIACDPDANPLTVFVRDFWQQYPKSLSARGSEVEVGLLPPLADDQYAREAEDPVTQVRLYYYLLNGVYKLRQGVTKAHELYLAAAAPGDDMPVAPLQCPLMAVADPEWTRQTGAWGNMPIGDAFWAAYYDRAMDGGFAAYLKDREDTRSYGALNFGDWWGERKYNWGNIEYDTQHALLQHFIRTGDIRYFFAGEQAARHNVDVDTVHFHADAHRVGGVYAHCLGHTGNYYGPGFVDGGSPSGGFTVSHTWTEGNLEEFLLTGDRRCLETALLVTDFYDDRYLNNYDFTNCRIPGWHLILTLATYRATGDPYYLNAARIITERVIERERPGGGWRRHMVPGHCYCTPRHHGNAGFMVGVLMRGLKDMHLETGDDRLPPVIVRAARKMVEEMWVPEKQGFRYTSCPESSAGGGMNLTSAEGFGYAVTLSGGDAGLTDVFERGMVIALQRLSGMGKSISHATRGTPHALRDLEDLAPTGYRLGPAGEYAVYLDQREGEVLWVQARRQGGEGAAEIELRDADGNQEALERVPPTESSAWVRTDGEGALGLHTLLLRATGNAAWTVGSTCLRDVVGIGDGLTLAAGKTQLFLGLPPQTPGKIGLKPHGGGRCRAALFRGGDEVATAAWSGGGDDEWQELVIQRTPEEAVLRLAIESESDVDLSVNGFWPYAAASARHFFVPTQTAR